MNGRKGQFTLWVNSWYKINKYNQLGQYVRIRLLEWTHDSPPSFVSRKAWGEDDLRLSAFERVRLTDPLCDKSDPSTFLKRRQ